MISVDACQREAALQGERVRELFYRLDAAAAQLENVAPGVDRPNERDFARAGAELEWIGAQLGEIAAATTAAGATYRTLARVLESSPPPKGRRRVVR